MTYADKLAEFVKATGHKPGEINRTSKTCKDGVRCGRKECSYCRFDSRGKQRTNVTPDALCRKCAKPMEYCPHCSGSDDSD